MTITNDYNKNGEMMVQKIIRNPLAQKIRVDIWYDIDMDWQGLHLAFKKFYQFKMQLFNIGEG